MFPLKRVDIHPIGKSVGSVERDSTQGLKEGRSDSNRGPHQRSNLLDSRDDARGPGALTGVREASDPDKPSGVGGCPNVGGICIGCTMPGFPDKFQPFMDAPPGSLVSGATSKAVGGDFENRLVPHDPTARKISLLGRRFAPRREFTQNGKESRVDPAAQAKPPPRVVRLAPVCRRIRQPGHVLGRV
jgi:hypothetical protein